MTEKSEQATEAKIELQKLPEGIFTFTSEKEKNGAALVHNSHESLMVSMVAPTDGEFSGGKRVIVEGPGGKNREVLEVGFAALSTQSSEGIALARLQLSPDAIVTLYNAAIKEGLLHITYSKPESDKWGPGGKMEQMTRLALDIAAKSGK